MVGTKARVMTMAVVLLTVAGCGGAGPATQAPTSAGGGAAATTTPGAGSTGGGATVTDPCTLLTQAEVTTVVGQPVGPGTADIEPKTCDWQFPADGVPTIQASITIQTGNTLADLCESPGSSALGFIVTDVTGVGDGACFTEVSGLASGDNLTFAKGNQVFTTAATLGPNATTAVIEAADKALAVAALAHIG